ncbi:MAG: hypothetical protein FWD68_16500 [Alphaproteobacteria bacterium]|nr:hypothetical protein [Alphaproteobacteria bacterium]
MSSYWRWRPYVPVAKRRAEGDKRVRALRKSGVELAPVTLQGTRIASSFWGKAWCDNLERYSDYASRLPRGRTYVRGGAVIDLKISKGKVQARVNGQDLYSVTITIAPVPSARWQSICRDCAGGIDSLVELLQGRLAGPVMDRVCRQADGLFPAPKEIKLRCDCPDWATMCKHVAATLYGVGARLDQHPELIFLLRGVNETDLISGAGKTLGQQTPVPESSNLLLEGDVGALFGLDMAENAGAVPVVSDKRRKKDRPGRSAATATRTAKAAGRKKPATKKSIVPARRTRAAAGGNKSTPTANSGAGKATPGKMRAGAKKAATDKRASSDAAPTRKRRRPASIAE